MASRERVHRTRATPRRRRRARGRRRDEAHRMIDRQRPHATAGPSARSSSSASTAASPTTSTRRSPPGSAPWLAALDGERHVPHRRLRRAVVHQPEQPVDRHRRAARRCTASAATTSSTRDAGAEVMMNDPKYLRAGTILAAFADAGANVAVVTAKDKLRALLGHRTEGHLLLGREGRPGRRSDENGIDDVLSLAGMPVPSVYSAELSEFVFAAGVRADASATAPTSCTCRRPTTSSTSTRRAPPAPTRSTRHDRPLPRRASTPLGATVVAHRRPRHEREDATRSARPNVIFLQDVLDAATAQDATRVILPITDPYVVHHGALGSFATVYVNDGATRRRRARADRARCPASSSCCRARAACAALRAAGRTAWAISWSSRERLTVIGSRRARHDLSGLDAPLRSHGGISEQRVPLIANRRRRDLPARRWRNFDAFDLAPQPSCMSLHDRRPHVTTAADQPADRRATKRCASPASASATARARGASIPYTGEVVGTVPQATRRRRAPRVRDRARVQADAHALRALRDPAARRPRSCASRADAAVRPDHRRVRASARRTRSTRSGRALRRVHVRRQRGAAATTARSSPAT